MPLLCRDMVSITYHRFVSKVECISATSAVVYHIRVWLPLPNTSLHWTAIDMDRKSSIDMVTSRCLGKNTLTSLCLGRIVNPLLVITSFNYQPLQVFRKKVARRIR